MHAAKYGRAPRPSRTRRRRWRSPRRRPGVRWCRARVARRARSRRRRRRPRSTRRRAAGWASTIACASAKLYSSRPAARRRWRPVRQSTITRSLPRLAASSCAPNQLSWTAPRPPPLAASTAAALEAGERVGRARRVGVRRLQQAERRGVRVGAGLVREERDVVRVEDEPRRAGGGREGVVQPVARAARHHRRRQLRRPEAAQVVRARREVPLLAEWRVAPRLVERVERRPLLARLVRRRQRVAQVRDERQRAAALPVLDRALQHLERVAQLRRVARTGPAEPGPRSVTRYNQLLVDGDEGGVETSLSIIKSRGRSAGRAQGLGYSARRRRSAKVAAVRTP